MATSRFSIGGPAISELVDMESVGTGLKAHHMGDNLDAIRIPGKRNGPGHIFISERIQNGYGGGDGLCCRGMA
jgi:hypothetical protein